MMYTGLPSPNQMPAQQMMPHEAPREMIIDVLGIRIPAEMLHSGYFWAFLAASVITVLLVSYWKYHRESG